MRTVGETTEGRDFLLAVISSERNLARLEDFPMIDRPRVCRRCNFRKLCFPKPGDTTAPPAAPEPVQAGLDDELPDEPS